MPYRIPIRPATFDELALAASPNELRRGDTEAIPDQLFDTITYVSAVTDRITLFNQTRANRNLSNMELAGTLPAKFYFQIFGIYVTYFIPPAATAWQDLQLLSQGGAAALGGPTLRIIQSAKEYGPWVLDAFHDIGGLEGFGTATDLNYARNASSGDTFWADGALMVPPQEAISLELGWSAPVTLTQGNTQIRVTLEGITHRQLV